FDLVGVATNVVAEAPALAAVGCQQAAQHADGRGLAAAIGPKEAVDRAALDLHAEVMHDLAAFEGFRKPANVNRDIGMEFRHYAHRFSAIGVLGLRKTLTGWPTRKASGRDGRAWTR